MTEISDASSDAAAPLTVPEDTERTWKETAGLWVCAAVIVTGAVVLLIAGIRFLTVTRGIGLVAPGAALIVAGLTALIAQLGLESWSEQKRKDRTNAEYEKRKEIYADQVNLMVGQVTGTYDATKDVQQRALIALWGSSHVVKTQAHWQDFISGLEISTGSTPLNYEQKMRARKLIANSVLAMRADLESDRRKASNQYDVMHSIFNK